MRVKSNSLKKLLGNSNNPNFSSTRESKKEEQKNPSEMKSFQEQGNSGPKDIPKPKAPPFKKKKKVFGHLRNQSYRSGR